MSGNTPVASNSLTVRIRLANKPGMLGRIASAIGEAGGDIGAVDVVEVTQKEMTRDVTFKASDEAHGLAVVERLRQVPDVTVVNVSDRTFLMHLGGKIEVNGRVAVREGSGDRRLDAAARDQVLAHWRFRPAMRDGRAVQAIGLVPINFRLAP